MLGLRSRLMVAATDHPAADTQVQAPAADTGLRHPQAAVTPTVACLLPAAAAVIAMAACLLPAAVTAMAGATDHPAAVIGLQVALPAAGTNRFGPPLFVGDC
jgi:hypothetical protein